MTKAEALADFVWAVVPIMLASIALIFVGTVAYQSVVYTRPELFKPPSREDQMFTACIRALGSKQGESPLCERVLFGDTKK